MLILTQIHFLEAWDFFPDPSFGPPGNESRGPKVCAKCAQSVRKVCGDSQNSSICDSISCEFERLKNELKNGSFQAGNRVFLSKNDSFTRFTENGEKNAISRLKTAVFSSFFRRSNSQDIESQIDEFWESPHTLRTLEGNRGILCDR